MNKDQISKRIKEIEAELSNLRAEMNKPNQITDFKVGDVFAYNEGKSTKVLILSTGYDSDRYVFGNNCNSGLKIYCDFSNEGGATKEEMLKKLNDNRAKFIKNINNDLNNLVNN